MGALSCMAEAGLCVGGRRCCGFLVCHYGRPEVICGGIRLTDGGCRSTDGG